MKYKIVELLSYFTPEEIKDFQKFISSSYFNGRQDLIKYYKILKEYYPDFSDKNFTKEKLIKKLIKGKEKNKGEILFRTLNSELFSLAQKYLVYKFTAESEFRINYDFTLILHQRNAATIAEKQTDKLQKALDIMTDPGDLYLSRIMVAVAKANNKFLRDNKDEISKTRFFISENALYLLFALLDYSINDFYVHSRNRIIKEERNIISVFLKNLNMKEIIKFLEESNQVEHKVLLIEIHRILMYFENNPKPHFEKLKLFLINDTGIMDNVFKYNVLIGILNFCTQNRNADLSKERFDFTKLGLDEGVFLNNDFKYIKISFFSVIVRNAFVMKELKWLEDNSKKILSNMQPQYKEYAGLYLTAFINFLQKNYSNSLENLSKISKPFSYVYDIAERELKIMNNIELSVSDSKYIETVLYALNNYRKFITEKKFELKEKMDACKIFISDASEILKNIEGKDNKFELEKIYKERNTGWVKDKCSELLGISEILPSKLP